MKNRLVEVMLYIHSINAVCDTSYCQYGGFPHSTCAHTLKHLVRMYITVTLYSNVEIAIFGLVRTEHTEN